MRRFISLCLLSCLLSACGGGVAALPTSPPPLPNQSPIPDNQPQPTVVAANPINVPGKLLFVNGGDLWVASGKTATRLTASGKKYHPAWSSDGRQIAYIQREESFADIWVMDAQNTNKTQITSNEPADLEARSTEHVQGIKWAFYPAWSPDGRWLTYVSQKNPPTGDSMDSLEEYPLSLYLYRTTRIAEQTLATERNEMFFYGNGFSDISHPGWSPDSTMIVYGVANRQSRELNLGFYNLETEDSGPLVGSTAETFVNTLAPTWSPQGDWLAYIRRENGASDIWVIAPPDATGETTGAPFRLTAVGGASSPTWSPDGKQLAFFQAKAGTIYLVIADFSLQAGVPQLTNIRDVHKGAIDVDSRMSWTTN